MSWVWKNTQLLQGIVNLWSPFKQTLLNFRYFFSLFITAEDIEWSLKSCLLETLLRVHYYYYCKPNVTLFLPIFTLMCYKSLLWIILKFPNPFLDEFGLISCSQRAGMMFIIVFQSLVNHSYFTSISRFWFVDAHEGEKHAFYFSLAFKKEILKLVFHWGH